MAATAAGISLGVTVVNGDLAFVPYPLLLGHYRSLALTGSEYVMDQLIGGAMQTALDLDAYPVAPGTNRIFVNSRLNPARAWLMPRPKAVIIAGLGEEGPALRKPDVVKTVRQAVIAWAQREREQQQDGMTTGPFDLGATLLGSSGMGVSAGEAAQLVAEGVRQANEQLAEVRAEENRWPGVRHLYLIELYLDRAVEAWRALQLQTQAAPGRFSIHPQVVSRSGALKRPIDSSYRGTSHDLIAALTTEGPHGQMSISYTIDTRRARRELRSQTVQARLIRSLVTRASDSENTDDSIGRTLFNLLVPPEMESHLGGTAEMLLQVDGGTAGIPWELLDTRAGSGGASEPWAVRTKLIRTLQTETFRQHLIDADAETYALVIGEPESGDKVKFPDLPGARQEARAVAGRLSAPDALGSAAVVALVNPDGRPGPDAMTVVGTLHARPWRIVHIAGHGDLPELSGPEPEKPGDPIPTVVNPRGVVLSDRTFLSPSEIGSLRVVPELVFVNCCFLAARDAGSVVTTADNRPRFAANVADALIDLGVRCVVAAGWAVEDDAAKAFAERFYDAVLRGERFIDAVAQARSAAFALGGNTWAAYQCYGDPEWRLRRGAADAQRPRAQSVDEFAGIASPRGLQLALETIAVRISFQGKPVDEQRDDLQRLESRFGEVWGDVGSVAEAFGAAWVDAGDSARGRRWYERALAAEDGSASLRAAERLATLRVWTAWEGVEKAPPAQLHDAADAARAEIDAAIASLRALVAITPNRERESLIGSAYKRLAMIAENTGDEAWAGAAIEAMRQHYQRAVELGRASNDPDLFYPALNWLAAEMAVNAGTADWPGPNPEVVESTRRSLDAATRNDPEFWNVVGVPELQVYEALARVALAPALPAIEYGFEDLYRRVSGTRLWKSTYDTARFVLDRYLTRASQAEQEAVRTLLARLRGYAGLT